MGQVRESKIVGLFGKSNNLKILNSFVYGKIIDPRVDQIKFTRITSCQGLASQEFLMKYLAYIRTKHSESKQLEYTQICTSMTSEYTKNLNPNFNRLDYVLFMSNGFLMATLEMSVFDIHKQDKMAGCSLGAMADLYNLSAMESQSNFMAFDLAIHAMLSGYHLAIETNKFE